LPLKQLREVSAKGKNSFLGAKKRKKKKKKKFSSFGERGKQKPRKESNYPMCEEKKKKPSC